MAQVDAIGVEATFAAPAVRSDIPVDIAVLNGAAQLTNPDGSAIAVGPQTRYAYAPPVAPAVPLLPALDLNADQ
uniref:hypothetical protein n=1 Tax=Sedimenticola sp. TaxID=1940285 RepID=UPI003D0CA8C3